MNPSGAVGAISAMHDAVTLANWISTLSLPTVPELKAVFEEYRAEWYPVAQKAFESSQVFSKALGKVKLIKEFMTVFSFSNLFFVVVCSS